MRYPKLITLAVISALTSLVSSVGDTVPDIRYYPLDNFPRLGSLAPDASVHYSRLPDSLKNVVRKDVWQLGGNSAGIAVRFRSDASNIKARWVSADAQYMNHMSATGSRGLDLYVLSGDSAWTTLGAARPNRHGTRTEAEVMRNMEPEMREYMLYLSLYNGVDSLEIGIDANARLLPPALDLPHKGKPIVMYGTSILQGGCATRPGMAHTNILMRRLQREVINLGFSGNALLDPEIARFMAQADASVFVIDAMPNCSAKLVGERMENFISIIREAHPDTPILLVECPVFPNTRYNRQIRNAVEEKNKVLKEIYGRLKASDDQLYYFEGADVLGDNVEATVDNTHFTDLGFSIYADALEPVLKILLNKSNNK